MRKHKIKKSRVAILSLSLTALLTIFFVFSYFSSIMAQNTFMEDNLSNITDSLVGIKSDRFRESMNSVIIENNALKDELKKLQMRLRRCHREVGIKEKVSMKIKPFTQQATVSPKSNDSDMQGNGGFLTKSGRLTSSKD